MGQIGRLNDTVFIVSRKQVKTIVNINWKISARYAAHNRHLNAPLLEFTGTETESFTFTILLSSYLGVNPAEEFIKLRAYLKEGRVLMLVIGKKVVGDYRWVIKDLQTSFEQIDNKGNIHGMKVNVTLNSYEKQ